MLIHQGTFTKSGNVVKFKVRNKKETFSYLHKSSTIVLTILPKTCTCIITTDEKERTDK